MMDLKMERTDLSECIPIGAFHFKGVIEGEYLDVILLPGDPPKTMVHNGKGWVEMDRPAYEFLSKEGYEQYRKQINAEKIGLLVELQQDISELYFPQTNPDYMTGRGACLEEIDELINAKIKELGSAEESQAEVLYDKALDAMRNYAKSKEDTNAREINKENEDG